MRQRLLLVLALVGCVNGAPVASPSPSPSCPEAWQARVRRPARFSQVAACVSFRATVRAVRRESDGDLHIQLLLDDDGDDHARQYLNARNAAAQHNTLVMEIEPWAHAAHTRALDPTHVDAHAPAAYCPASCAPRAGDRLQVTSAIVTDNEPDHGWNEAHSPSDVVLLGHGPPPAGDVDADPTEPD